MKIQDYLCLNNNHIWISHIIVGVWLIRVRSVKGECWSPKQRSRTSSSPLYANEMTICKFPNFLISASRTNHFWLLSMVCVLRRHPRSNIWSAREDQDLCIGLTFHRCETSNLDSVFQNCISFLIVATSCSLLFVFVGSDLQLLAHSTKLPSRREWIHDCEWKKERKPPSLIMNYLFTHFSHQLALYLYLLLGIVAVPNEILTQ